MADVTDSQSPSHAATPPPGQPPLLAVSGLTKAFPGTLALDRVDLQVRAGEVHALLGENGAGKSTLIKCVTGAHRPTAGSIRVAGQEVQIASPQDATRHGIAVVHQHFNLVPTMTVQENLVLGGHLPRRLGIFVNWREVEAQARRHLERVGLRDIDPKAHVADLRPDQVAMVSIARAVASDAKVIILDEPTAALVPQEVDILFGHMRRLANEGHGFLYVSHRLAEVFDISDRITVLRDGRFAGSWAHDAIDRRTVVQAIVGRSDGLADEVAQAGKIFGDTVLRVEGLSADRIAAASFAARAGEILGIAGLPGSGAEEVFDVLYGRRRMYAGLVQIDGEALDLGDPRRALRGGMALVPKDRHKEALFPGFSVRENISLPSLARMITDPVFRFVHRGREREMAGTTAADLNVKMSGLETKIDSLSGGNQQKAVLGRWFAHGARVFLLNSPTAAVDVGAKAEIYELTRRLADEGTAVLFTSTEVEEFPRVCHRVLVFHDGRIVGELTGHAMTETAIMNLAAGGQDGPE
ncbi:MAG: sugar ABC transporter ATP-binding protein [Sneathiellaceae bacterium]